MKSIYYISLLFLVFAFAQESFSQESRPRRTRTNTSEAPVSNAPALTERVKIKNEVESKAPEHIVWLREIYRNIDLKKENNAALYYPIQPIGDRVNLFTLIFKLMADGKISAYNYIGEREVFTEEEKVKFEDILKKYQILYTTQGSGDNVSYLIDNGDIPSEEATMYMIKEGWYFDEATGSFKSRIIALCPMLIREDYYYGGTTNNPLFWVTYEELRPYLSRELIMTSNYNNALTYTMDDYFSKKLYSGEIIKTTNLMNQSLVQQVGDSLLKHAQDSIETQLKAFRSNLWVYNDSIAAAQAQPKGKKVKKAKADQSEEKVEKTSGRSAKKEKEPKQSTPKTEKTTSPTRSVRKR
jgi:gliding motility associated protien GldN